VLVINGKQGSEDAEADYWLRLIESFGGNSPVIVVLNKIKEHRFDLNQRALEQKYVGIREFVRTDCEDRTGITDLRRAIERETDRLEHLRVAFPANWFTIKDRLGGMKKSFLSFDEYREICVELGEASAETQDQLAGYLHSLGIVLNFKDDPRLHDTHVLNPEWVTKGIYSILDSDRLAEQKGEIQVKDLAAILDKKDYPVKMHGFLIDLMRKFDLCFALGDDMIGRYLIPELLAKEESEETADFKPAECLNFQYHYPVLPDGLLPRFIVRTHAISIELPRWRSGVILKFEGNYALVRGDAQGRKVYISISGPARGRRKLLAIIRTDFERIHGDIAKLQPKPMVPVPDHPDVLVPYEKLLKFEEKDVSEFQELADDEVLTLSVRELLDGVEVERVRPRDRIQLHPSRAVRLFISYAHKDESLRAELDAHLKLLQRTGLIQKWDDRLLKPGEEWQQGIDENLERADIILLLVSADFLNSDFCWQEEMEKALQRHEAGEARVIPVIIRDTIWTKAKFAKLQALPREGKAITLWTDRDSAWRNVAEGIQKAAEEIRAREPM
jgi:internalin A